MKKKHLFIIITFIFVAVFQSLQLTAQEKIVLWPQGAPDAKGNQDKDKPNIAFYPAPKDTNCGAAVLICPGGGYVNLAYKKEGTKFAQWFNQRGINAFVLKYRLSTWDVAGYTYPAQFNDACRAMRIIRYRAGEWNIDPAEIGIMGFSAGGHLASTVATHFDSGNPAAKNPVEKISCRPNFMMLIYPVISFTTPYSHRFSRKVLLGENPDMELIEKLSNENQISTMTPPTFLIHGNSDSGVPPENSILFYQGLRKAEVPAEIHIFEKGEHGFGLAENQETLAIWPELMHNWLKNRGIYWEKTNK